MLTTDALKRLREFQSRILAQADAVLALLALAPETAQPSLARARWALARTSREYQLFKHGEIFDPAITQGDVRQANDARRLRGACLAASKAYAGFVKRWSQADVVALWAEHQAEVRGLVDGIRGHIALERREIEALLAGSTQTRKPARAPLVPLTLRQAAEAISPGRSPPAARADTHAR